ncbi:MAG: hypothetical protein JSU01_17165 [Bacteroidetes bacterium]|nr:hypothetical protein [Bacteroidota bacterium]
MDWKLFFIGLGFLTAAYFIIRNLIRERPSSEKNNWGGPPIYRYIQGWFISILCVVGGIVSIVKSLL